MDEILPIDGKKVDKVLSDIAKLILHLGRSSKKSKERERLIQKITEIHNEIEHLIIKARLKKSTDYKWPAS